MFKWFLIRLAILFSLGIPVSLFWNNQSDRLVETMIYGQLIAISIILFITFSQYNKACKEYKTRQNLWKERYDNPTLPKGFGLNDKTPNSSLEKP